MSTESTKLIYMENSTLCNSRATVVQHTQETDGKSTLILDQTIFYPQGGGQPFDLGTITHKDGAVFSVEEVRFKDGLVYHKGTTNSVFKMGEVVELTVDKERRDFNSRNHTAGHLVDLALSNLGYKLIPGKGYHFPTGAYVEHLEPIEDEQEREKLKDNLQKELNRLIEQSLPITVKLASLQELAEICDYVPDYLPKDKPARVMLVEGYPGFPCGGTHATNTGEVGVITVDKIRNKKACLRVSYSIS